MMNKKAKISITLLFLAISILIISISNAQETYLVGDIIKLDLRGFGPYVAQIQTPMGEYLQKGETPFFTLELPKEGSYSVFVKSETHKKLFQYDVKTAKEPSTTTEEGIYYDLENITITPLEETALDESPIKQTKEGIRNRHGATIIAEHKVTWTKTLEVKQQEARIIMPDLAENITISNEQGIITAEIKESIESKVLGVFSDTAEKIIELPTTTPNATITYETPAPQQTERQLNNIKKEVILTSPLHYENVLAYTTIEEKVSLHHKDDIKLYWKENDTYLEFDAYDNNNNGLIDYLEWIAPHLSTQTFEIIIATKAVHLDSQKEIIEDIYDSIKTADGINSPTINEGEFVQVTFEKQLTNTNDISFLGTITSGRPTINIYVAGTTTRIAQYSAVVSGEYNKAYLTELTNPEDTFDLEVVGGSMTFDHIIDPSGYLAKVQRGTFSMTATTANITINPVNTSKAFVLISTMSSSDTANILHVSATLLNSTTIFFQKYSTTATTVSWEVIEGPFNVQRGESTTSGTGIAVMNASLTQAVNLSNSLIIISARMNSGTANQNVRDFWTAEFYNTTQINFTRGVTGTNAQVVWQVVEWYSSSVQSSISAATNTPTIIPLATPVNLSTSFIYTTKRSSTTSGVDTQARAYFINDSFIAVSRSGTTGTTLVRWYVITSPHLQVQSGFNSFSATTPQTNTLSNVNTSSTFTLASNEYSGANTNYGRTFVTTNLTNSTGLNLQKLGGTSTVNSSWYVNEFQYDTINPQYQGITTNVSNTNPDTEVLFESNWTDTYGLDYWEFYWDIGGGFTSAGTGNFFGLNNSNASITKVIPSSMEGKTLNYFFRAYDLSGLQNQTSGNNNITINDITPPTINSQSATPTNTNYGQNITLEANITDGTGVHHSWATINLPNSTSINRTLTNISTQLWQFNYTNTLIGPYNATIYANDTGGLTSNGSTLYWNVTGYSNVSLYSPATGSIPAEIYVDILCRVFDDNTTNPIANYPVTFSYNNTLIGTNTTNASGIARYNWSTQGLGAILLNCSINHNETLYYNYSRAYDTKEVTILYPNLSIISLTHENYYHYNLNEYEITDKILWINATINNTGLATAYNTNITLQLNYPDGTPASWFTTTYTTCGNLNSHQTCTIAFTNNSNGFVLSEGPYGNYTINITTNWSGGGIPPSTNTNHTTIYNTTDNMTGYLTDHEVSAGINTTYSYSMTNPWSRNITNLNITINCPTVPGLRCFYNSTGNLSYYYGTLMSNQSMNITFNVTTNSTVIQGTHPINVTVTYQNPAGDTKTYTYIKQDELIISPLIAVIASYTENMTRTNNYALEAYVKNIGTVSVNNANYSWQLPLGWNNITGYRTNQTTTLGIDQYFYGNITINPNISSALGPVTITFIGDSSDTPPSINQKTVSVYTTTTMNATINNTSPYRGETILIDTRIIMDNGTIIPGQNITLQGIYTNQTNTSGHASFTYQVPLNATLGTNNYTISLTYEGNQTIHTLTNTNNTNISVQDQILITANHSPSTTGYGNNITINATISSGINLSTVYANITSPIGNNYYQPLTSINQTHYQLNFTQTWKNGNYNYTINANNTEGFSNQTNTQNFSITGNISLIVDTKGSFFISNEYVNLTEDADEVYVRSNVQRGTFAMTTTSQNITINAVNTSKAFVLLSTMSASDTPNILHVTATLVNSTTIQFDKNSATSTTVSWEVIEGPFTVQRGEIATANNGGTGTASMNIDLQQPADTTKSFIILTGRINSGTAGNNVRDFWTAHTVNNTRFNVTRGVTGTNAIVSWQAVTWEGAQVQHGIAAATNTPTIIPLATPVNLSTSFIYTTKRSTTTSGVDTQARAYFINDSFIAIDRGGTTGTTHVAWYVLSSSQVQVQSGFNSFSATTPQTNTLSNVNTSSTFTLASNEYSGANTNYGRTFVTTNLTNSTGLNLQKLGGTSTVNSSWYVIDFVGDDTNVTRSSKIINNGTTNIQAYYLLTIETNNTGNWTTIDTVLNDTATMTTRTITSGTTQNLSDYWNTIAGGWNTNNGIGGGDYRARVSLVDPQGTILTNDDGTNMSSYALFQIDFNPPTVTLYIPENESTNLGVTARLNYTAEDPSGVVNCSLFHNRSGLFTLEETKTHTPGINNTFTLTGFTENTYIRWNVRCFDGAGNTGFTSGDYYFNQIVPPDYTTNTTLIIPTNTSTIIEGTNLTINVTIWNMGGQTGTTNISFYDGDPDNGGTIISNTTLQVILNQSNTTRFNWTTRIGPTSIYVILDPPLATNGTIPEVNESNNQAYKTINVPSWQDYYGNTSIQLLLAISGYSNITTWGNESNLDGNIFITDQEASISWTTTQALGKNTSGLNSSNDFSELDWVLGIQNFSDSITAIFTTNQLPNNTTMINAYTNNITGVPIINSTTTSNFITGILWDYSDDAGNNEYDNNTKEDIIFVSPLNKQKNGYYGIYDYEIHIPVRLRHYNTADQNKVNLYYALN